MGQRNPQLSLSENRFILTLASVSSILQSEFPENEYAEAVVMDIIIPQVQGYASVSILISEFARDRQIPQGSDLFRHRLIFIVGIDARKLIADGYPFEQVVTSDLRQGGPFFAT